MKQPLIILTGPTAVGKTALSIELAKALNGEIISADSMQVYRHMDIGSAKIMPEEMEGVPHHLIDVLEPWEEFNVTRFQSMAKEAMAGIYSRGHVPIVTGGTGFYIQALAYDIDFTENEDHSGIREKLEQLAAEKGEEHLHQMLAEIDPESAEAIHANNVKRVIRAIEYYRLTGEKISEHNKREREKQSPYDLYYYVLTRDRAALYERIDRPGGHHDGAGPGGRGEAFKRNGLHPGHGGYAGTWIQGNPGLSGWKDQSGGGSLYHQARHEAFRKAPAHLV